MLLILLRTRWRRTRDEGRRVDRNIRECKFCWPKMKNEREGDKNNNSNFASSSSLFSIWLSHFFSFLLLLPLYSSLSRPFPSRESEGFLFSTFRRSKSSNNVRSPARPPRFLRAGGGPARRRPSPHRPPRPRGGQEGRGPPYRGTVDSPCRWFQSRLHFATSLPAEAHETREESALKATFFRLPAERLLRRVLFLTRILLRNPAHFSRKQVQVGDEEAPEMAVKRFRRSAGNANVVMEIRG
jgi:hypothetical protein